MDKEPCFEPRSCKTECEGGKRLFVADSPEGSRSVSRVVIIDDSMLVRYRVKHLLSKEEGLAVVGEAENGLDGVRLVHALRPDLVVMDIKMPLLDGIEATCLIKAAYPDTVVIGFSSLRDRETSRQFLKVGAAGIVDKGMSWQRLVEAVRRCLEARALALS